jgi:isocitrate/isopropylmalate dehydrogenase
MMLQHMGLHDHAARIQKATFDTLAEGKVSFASPISTLFILILTIFLVPHW